MRAVHGASEAGHDPDALWPEVDPKDLTAALAYAKEHPEEVAQEPDLAGAAMELPLGDQFFCPTCPCFGATVDEDGLCVSCGGTTAPVRVFLDELAKLCGHQSIRYPR